MFRSLHMKRMLIVLVLNVPVGADAAYIGGEFTLAARANGFSFQILPKKPGSEDKPPKEKKPKKEKKRAAARQQQRTEQIERKTITSRHLVSARYCLFIDRP